MHIQKTKILINKFRYGFLVLLIVFHIVLINNKTYTVTVLKSDVNHLETKVKIKHLDEKQYDSIIRTIPETGFKRVNAISNTRVYFCKILPYWILNVVYCLYIYYLIVIVIRTIITVKKMKS